jgi:hypothetical protein
MRSVVIAWFVIACSSERPHAVDLPRALPQPVETASGTLLTPRPPQESGQACVMLYECGCNSACVKVDRPMSKLSPNTQVTIATGPWKGTSVYVAKQTSDTGEAVLTVQRTDPQAPIQICALPRSSLVGYLCGTSNLGPARACTTCE